MSIENEKLLKQIIAAAEEIGVASEEPESSPDDALIDELANLDIAAYEKRRIEAANNLGFRASVLDTIVEKRRTELAGEAQDQQLLPHWTVEPWPDPVDGDALVLALVRCIQRHVVMNQKAALTVALWIIFAWVHEEAATHSPILMVTSPEPDCGKSTLLGLIGFLTPRSLPSADISPAALFRSIEKWQPTLIIDEADVAFVDNNELRSVVNCGWTRGTGVVRCVGDDHIPRLFPTFCPKAIGLKGKRLPDTTASRAIVIELRRKLPHEQVDDFLHLDSPELQRLRQQLHRWKIDNAEALAKATPVMPGGFVNRVGANWKLLVAIADAAGGDWPEKAREAAMSIAALKATNEASIGVQLLGDIRTVFGNFSDSVFSKVLIDQLTGDAEKPWAEFHHGKPLTQKQLAALLKSYGILSETVWIEGKSLKGYKRERFEDEWRRYLAE